MAQHVKIEEWELEPWYPKIIKLISFWAFKTRWERQVGIVNQSISNLPLDAYKLNEDTTRVFVYRTKSITKKLGKDDGDMKVCDVAFEVHMRGNDVQQIYIPL